MSGTDEENTFWTPWRIVAVTSLVVNSSVILVYEAIRYLGSAF